MVPSNSAINTSNQMILGSLNISFESLSGATKTVSGTKNKGYPQSTIKKNKITLKPLPAKTGQAETANETPRPRSDSYEARSTGRLDHVPTHTRLARRDSSTTEKSPSRTTRGRATRPTLVTNSETKVRAFNATTNHFLSPWLQQQPAWR
jgi:hypothetical protein